MLYLDNSTGRQEVLLHTTGLEAAGVAAVIRFASTISGELACFVPMEISAPLTEYMRVRLELPEGLAQGEYRYEVVQDGRIIGSGLAVIGQPAAIAQPATEGEGIDNIVITQYGE